MQLSTETTRPSHLELVDGVVVEHGRSALASRRFGDLVIASVATIVAAIPMVILALLVKATSSGPVLFRQDRVGRGGVHFRVMKFRTMTDGTHDDVLSSETDRRRYIENDFKLDSNDCRITRLGRVLRKTSLDELPQLINVLRGDMSLVGIRPLVPVELGMRPLRDQQLYATLRPGVTGLWQVEGRSTLGKVERLELDRRYVETWSPWQDVKILARTPLALLRIRHTH
ncbi:MAG: sugar transferase [Actinomycetota bacterium]